MNTSQADNKVFVMSNLEKNKSVRVTLFFILVLSMTLTGCRPFDYADDPLGQPPASEEMEPPRELTMVSLPAYRLAPPDVVMVEIHKMVPKPPYHLSTLDVLRIDVLGTLLDQPINDFYMISAEGIIDLGPAYGSLRVEGMTADEARVAVTNHLSQVLRMPEVSLRLAQMAGLPPISGQYQVCPDGCINLRHYGSVYIAGMTLTEAKFAIEDQLSHYLNSPSISIDIVAYNSKSYYVVTQGAANGDSVRKMPITGNETVLDAISNIGGIPQVSNQKMWIARPVPGNSACEQKIPIDWVAISNGATSTNYQLFPNDRLVIAQDNFLTTANWISRIVAPFERIAGVATFGASTIRNLRNVDSDYNNGYGY
ncbi:MAG: polysaccharide biosynthesis/export family protein [Planctomycetia bacterium]|nr:polysaccharide biosynthesis/export family protein [Planctomycetia bacterium]